MNTKFLILISFIATLFTHNFVLGSISPKQILIPSGQADESKYEFYLSQNHHLIRPSDFFVNRSNDLDKQSELRYSFIQAKQAYLNSKFYQAQTLFKKIIGQANKSHWDFKSKKIILTSLALNIELTSKPKQKLKYIRQLGGLFPHFDLNEIDLDSNLKKELNQEKEQYWVVSPKTSPYSQAIINGVHHSLFPGKKIRIPSVEFLITLLSDKHLPITFVTSKNKLNDLQSIARTIINGDCDAHTFKSRSQFGAKSTYLYFNDQCILDIDNNKKIISKKLQKSGLDLKISSLPIIQDPEQIIEKNNIKKKNTHKWSWLKNKWVWAGVSAAIVGYKIIENNKRKRNGFHRPPPGPVTTTTGQGGSPSVKEGW